MPWSKYLMNVKAGLCFYSYPHATQTADVESVTLNIAIQIWPRCDAYSLIPWPSQSFWSELSRGILNKAATCSVIPALNLSANLAPNLLPQTFYFQFPWTKKKTSQQGASSWVLQERSPPMALAHKLPAGHLIIVDMHKPGLAPVCPLPGTVWGRWPLDPNYS